MPDQTRWNLRVSPETDNHLRSLLASRGRRRGDLSCFVELAVLRQVLRELMTERHPHRADHDLDRLMRLADEEVAEHERAGRTRA